jgi:hypothetical protein
VFTVRYGLGLQIKRSALRLLKVNKLSTHVITVVTISVRSTMENRNGF